MPKVTRLSEASDTALAMIFIAFLSSIWSDGNIPATELPYLFSISRIPEQMAGSVFFPSGSIIIFSAGISYPHSFICPDTKNFWDSLVTINISVIFDRTRHLSSVSWNNEVLPNFKNCLGYCSRLRGHRRVPEPPASIIDFMLSSPYS